MVVNVLSCVFSYKYLECILTPDLRDNLDIDQFMKSFNQI